MIKGKSHIAMLGAAALMLALSACQKNESGAGEGTAERVGQQIDQAAAKAGEQLNKAAEEAGKGLQAAGEKLQSAGQHAQQSAQEGQSATQKEQEQKKE